MNHSISFCTVCMNRLHHLKQTLPQNIKDNIDYPEIEFLVVDYNSRDGLEDWIREEMAVYLEMGILTYIKVEGPEYFHRSHSRNVAFKMAEGEVLVNVDADNYTGKGFANFINLQFLQEDKIFLIPDTRNDTNVEIYGKVCVRKKDFMTVKGYDEELVGWGFEDIDFYTRLQNLGLNQRLYDDDEYAKCIVHGPEDRVSNQENFHKLHTLFAISEKERAELVFLYKDGTFERGVFLMDKTEMKNFAKGILCVLEDDVLESGTWTFNDKRYLLKNNNPTIPDESFMFNMSRWPIYFSNHPEKQVYQKITKTSLINYSLMMHQASGNYIRFKSNYHNKKIVVNADFGVATTSFPFRFFTQKEFVKSS